MRVPLLAALLTLTACDQLYVEAVVPKLCQHLDEQHFVIPPEVRARYAQLPQELQQSYQMEKSFDFDLALQLPAELQKAEAKFSLSSVRLTAVAPTADFGFLDSASVTLQPNAESSLEAHTFTYERQVAHPAEIVWDGESFDLEPYLEAGGLKYSLALVGTLPEGDIVADVDACASASVKVNYLAR
jgi:hypothetical protein